MNFSPFSSTNSKSNEKRNIDNKGRYSPPKKTRKHLSLIITSITKSSNNNSPSCLSWDGNPSLNVSYGIRIKTPFKSENLVTGLSNKENVAFTFTPEAPPISSIEFSFQDYSCPEFLEKYRIINFLGRGAQAVVIEVEEKSTNQIFAAKVLKTSDQEKKMMILNEANNLRSICHPNICQFKELILDELLGVYIIILEYSDYRRLDKNITGLRNDEAKVKQIFMEILKTISYLHSMKICHRDLNMENILISKDQTTIKLIDLGLSKLLLRNDDVMMSPTGNSQYRAPEMSVGEYSYQVDIWSLGICLLELLTGKRVSSKEIAFKLKIENLGKLFTEEVSEEAIHLIKSMLHPNPKKRISAEDCLQHPWFHT